jgi:spoIIIJ-associated protein
LADKAKREKRNIVLEPMLPSERRIIHLTLQDNPSISTFSQGEEPMRKVIISPRKRSNGSEGRRPRNNVEA